MKLIGLQKMTVLDFPGRVACIVFTFGCNFRCPFCHNASLVIDTHKNRNISEEEIFSFLKILNDKQGIAKMQIYGKIEKKYFKSTVWFVKNPVKIKK